MPERHVRGIRNHVKPWKRRVAVQMSRHKTWPEKILWARLKDRQLGVNFKAQQVILGFVADFYCGRAGLVVEIDGSYHLTAKRKIWDIRRDAAMKQKGIAVMRFTASDVCNNVAAVVALIRAKVLRRMA
jgi:cyclase